jgi:hypothetical protein
MRTLQEHFGDLDKMVDGGMGVTKTREQIGFIWSQVSALQTDYARLDGVHTKFQETQTKIITDLQSKNQTLVAEITKLINPSPTEPRPWGGKPPISGRMDPPRQ